LHRIFVIIALYILLNNCDSFTGLGPQGKEIQTLMTIHKATTYNWHMLPTDSN